MKLIFQLVFLLCFVSQAFGLTNVDRYVTTTCANNGDGTSSSCAASNGAAGAYTTLANAISDITADNADFTSADIKVTVHCKGSTADTSEPHITGFTFDATRYLVVQVDSGDRHPGYWSTSHYRIVNSSYYGAIRISENYVSIIGLQLENNRTGSSAGTEANGVKLTRGGVSGGKIVFTDNLVKYTGDYVNVEAYGLYDDFNGANWTNIYINNIFWDWKKGGYFRTGNDGTLYLYNNTIYSNAASSICFIIRDYGTGTVVYHMKNNLAQGSCTNYDIDGNAVKVTATNLSEDTTSPNNTWDSKVVTFVDETGRNLHLDSSDTNAINQGTDLSAAAEGFTTDIDQQTRSGTWDIGADEYIAGGSAVPALINLGY